LLVPVSIPILHEGRRLFPLIAIMVPNHRDGFKGWISDIGPSVADVPHDIRGVQARNSSTAALVRTGSWRIM
jgi:hypothetical protein